MRIATASEHKAQCFIFRKRKIPPVSWLLLSPQRPFAFAGTPLRTGFAMTREFTNTALFRANTNTVLCYGFESLARTKKKTPKRVSFYLVDTYWLNSN